VTPVLLMLATLSSTASAEPGPVGVTRQPTGIEGEPDGLGLGLVVGEPSGLAFAFRTGEETNIQGGLGWSFASGRLHLTGDYTRNLLILRPDDTPEVRFPVYAGVGGRVRMGFDDRGRGYYYGTYYEYGTSLGVRAPVGIALLPTNQRIDVFVELAPVLIVVPATYTTLDGAVGARIFL